MMTNFPRPNVTKSKLRLCPDSASGSCLSTDSSQPARSSTSAPRTSKTTVQIRDHKPYEFTTMNTISSRRTVPKCRVDYSSSSQESFKPIKVSCQLKVAYPWSPDTGNSCTDVYPSSSDSSHAERSPSEDSFGNKDPAVKPTANALKLKKLNKNPQKQT